MEMNHKKLFVEASYMEYKHQECVLNTSLTQSITIALFELRSILLDLRWKKNIQSIDIEVQCASKSRSGL